MERRQAQHASLPADAAGLRRREMMFLGGEGCILLQKGGFDKKLVGAARQRHDPGDVNVVEGGVGNVGYGLAGSDTKRMPFQVAERDRDVVGDLNDGPVRRAAADGALGLVEPTPDRKAEASQRVAQHVDTHRLAQREGDTRRAVIERRGRDPELVFVENDARHPPGGRSLDAAERLARREGRRPLDAVIPKLFDDDAEIDRVSAEEVPCKGSELVLDPLDEPERPDETKRLGTVKADPQQPVEAGEMIHVGVRDEGVAHAQDFARGERPKVAEIEQERPAAEAEVNVEARVIKWAVDQPRLDEPSHGVGAERLAISETVRLPRWRKAASYSAQFVVRRRCFRMR